MIDLGIRFCVWCGQERFSEDIQVEMLSEICIENYLFMCGDGMGILIFQKFKRERVQDLCDQNYFVILIKFLEGEFLESL